MNKTTYDEMKRLRKDMRAQEEKTWEAYQKGDHDTAAQMAVALVLMGDPDTLPKYAVNRFRTVLYHPKVKPVVQKALGHKPEPTQGKDRRQEVLALAQAIEAKYPEDTRPVHGIESEEIGRTLAEAGADPELTAIIVQMVLQFTAIATVFEPGTIDPMQVQKAKELIDVTLPDLLRKLAAPEQAKNEFEDAFVQPAQAVEMKDADGKLMVSVIHPVSGKPTLVPVSEEDYLAIKSGETLHVGISGYVTERDAEGMVLDMALTGAKAVRPQVVTESYAELVGEQTVQELDLPTTQVHDELIAGQDDLDAYMNRPMTDADWKAAGIPEAASDVTPEQITEYRQLVADGLSEAEAQGTVWPEPVNPGVTVTESEPTLVTLPAPEPAVLTEAEIENGGVPMGSFMDDAVDYDPTARLGVTPEEMAQLKSLLAEDVMLKPEEAVAKVWPDRTFTEGEQMDLYSVAVIELDRLRPVTHTQGFAVDPDALTLPVDLNTPIPTANGVTTLGAIEQELRENAIVEEDWNTPESTLEKMAATLAPNGNVIRPNQVDVSPEDGYANWGGREVDVNDPENVAKTEG